MARQGPAAVPAVDLQGEAPGEAGPVPDQPVRAIDRLDPRVVNVLTVLGFGLPVAGYLWFVGRYSINVIVADQFDDVTVIGHTYTHVFDWSALWAQHNENRVFFPNLIVVLLARTTHFNVQVEEYLGAAMLMGAVALILWAHKRRSPSIPWLYYCPVAVLAFSVVQYENSLWGFQMAWYLVLLSLAATVFLLDRISLTWLVYVAAVGAAVVGSLSSLQGLFIWPAGLVLLYHRRRGPLYAISWIAAAAATTILYFRNYNSGATAGIVGVDWKNLTQTLKQYFFSMGEILGVRVDRIDSGNRAVVLLGLLLVLLALATIVVYGIRRDLTGGSPIGVALICVGLLFDAATTEGRYFGGYLSAGASRYTTFDLLVPIGIYLAWLGRPTLAWGHRRQDRRLDTEARGAQSGDRAGGGIPGWVTVAVRGVIGVVILVQIPFGINAGIAGARYRYAGELVAVRVEHHIDRASVGQIDQLYIFQSTAFIRQQVRTAEKYHLSAFTGGTGG